MKQIVKLLSKEHLTHDVLRLVLEKPDEIHYLPGQAVDLSIHRPQWENELRAFTFTSLEEDSTLEFTIKTYPAHNGVTAQLLNLNEGDELVVHDVFGDIHYKGEGLFIAGGAGITPFIAIFKQLQKNNQLSTNRLLFANKTQKDIILKDYFHKLLGDRFVNVLSEESHPNYAHGYITKELIQQQLDVHNPYYYLCGPDPMMNVIEKQLYDLGVSPEFIVREGF